MIFKGFTDENGNVIPVQGAGTVYNEEKNSIAIGKDTNASGQDQFVLGRANEPNTTLAEIVGGGVAQGSSNIKKVYWYDEDHGVQGYYLLQKVASTQEEFESYVKDLYTVDSVQHNTSLNTPNWNNMKGVYKYLSAHTGSDYSNVTDYSSDNYRYWLIEADNKVVGVWTGHSPSNDYAECTWLAGRLNPISIVDDSYKNIRTLDWDGNEHIAGSLAIGKNSIAGTEGQLVFGRGNVEDVNKVEIVGGSIEVESDTYYTYLELLTALQIDDSLEVNDPWNAIQMIIPINHQEHPISAVFVKKASNFQDMLTVLTAAEGKEVIYTNSEWPDYRKNSVNLFRVSLSFETESAETMWIISESTGRYFDIYFNNRGGGTQRLIYLVEMARTDKALKRSSTVKKMEFQETNIRTLDWQGTQWNAGDVTCDDEEHENVLSLRETAAKADELETSKADAVHTHNSIAEGLGSGQTMKMASVIAEMDGNDNPRVHIRIAPSRDLHYDANIDASSIANLKRALAEPDATPTEDSNNLMTSGAIYAALAALDARITALETE